jgi:hypothetical protein
MAYKPLDPYKRAPMPAIAGSERQFINNELAKLEKTLAAIVAAIEELRKKVP